MYYNIHSNTKGTPSFHVNIYIYFSTSTYAPTYIRCCIKDETYTHISYFVVFYFGHFVVYLTCAVHTQNIRLMHWNRLSPIETVYVYYFNVFEGTKHYNSYYNKSDLRTYFLTLLYIRFPKTTQVVKRGHMRGPRVDGCHVGESSHMQSKKLLYWN